jgi:hypothetical protein
MESDLLQVTQRVDIISRTTQIAMSGGACVLWRNEERNDCSSKVFYRSTKGRQGIAAVIQNPADPNDTVIFVYTGEINNNNIDDPRIPDLTSVTFPIDLTSATIVPFHKQIDRRADGLCQVVLDKKSGWASSIMCKATIANGETDTLQVSGITHAERETE